MPKTDRPSTADLSEDKDKTDVSLDNVVLKSELSMSTISSAKDRKGFWKRLRSLGSDKKVSYAVSLIHADPCIVSDILKSSTSYRRARVSLP